MSAPEAKKEEKKSGGDGDHAHEGGMSPWTILWLVLAGLFLLPVGMRSCSSEVSVGAAQIASNAVSINMTMGFAGRIVVGILITAIIVLIIKHYSTKH